MRNLQANPMDPSALISPVTDALSTLGQRPVRGRRSNADAAGHFAGFPVHRRLAADSRSARWTTSWQGASGTAAAAKTTNAIANGAEVGAQSDALRASLATAATNVRRRGRG